VASTDRQFAPLGVEPTPAGWELPSGLFLQPKVIFANFDGTLAAGAFLPSLQVVSDSGHVVFEVPVSTAVAAGGSASVTWAPFLRTGGGSGTSGGAGLGTPGTYLISLPSGASQCIIDAVGGGGGGPIGQSTGTGAVSGSSGGGGGAYQHLEAPVSTMAFPLTVVVAAGGASGVPFTHPTGFNGGNSTVTDANGIVWLTALGGTGGPLTGGGGAGGTATTSGLLTGISGGGGGASGSAGGVGGSAGNVAGGGTSGGGGGGGETGAGLVSNNGGKGGNLTLNGVTIVTGGAAGVAPGGMGGNAPQLTNIYAGAGGGGGGGNAVAGHSGGVGGSGYRGGGGGAGGVSTGGGSNVNGGAGGDGFVRILFV
jgi:hypothetical protein